MATLHIHKVQHTTGVCGGNACIRNTRIPVWTLVSLRSQGATDKIRLGGLKKVGNGNC